MLARFTSLAAPLTPLILAVHLGAQSPSPWTVLPVTGGVQMSGIVQRGKILAYRDGGTVHAYSALTRSWRSTTISGGATLRIANDLLIIRDGTRFTAFASYSGRFASITVSATGKLVNPSTQGNDSIAVVADGTDLWAFSGFIGKWTRRTISGSAKVAVQRHVAIIADGKQLHGMSAFRGQWTATTMAATATMIAVDGTIGVATAAGRIHGFSALRETWQTATSLLGTAKFAIDDDTALWWDGISYLGFSGLRGSFSKLVTGMPALVEVTEQLAVARQGKLLWIYSAPTGTWTQATLATVPTVAIQTSLVLMLEQDKAHAFSAVRGKLATVNLTPTNSASSATVAAVVDSTGNGSIFSAPLARWTPLPSGAKNALPALASTGALVTTTTGFSAFSARTGSYHEIATGAGAKLHSDVASAILAVEETRRLHVFEPRRNAWLQTPISGSGRLRLHFWRTNFLALDGNRALGFGSFHGRINGTLLSGTFREIRSHSESGRAVTSTSIAAFSAVPLLSSPWQYPEFRRTFVGGSKLDLHLSAAAATGQTYVALGVAKPFALHGLGNVFLDSALLLPITLPLDARNGTARTTIAVPDIAGLRGIEVFIQALVIPTTGQPYVTDLASVLLY